VACMCSFRLKILFFFSMFDTLSKRERPFVVSFRWDNRPWADKPCNDSANSVISNSFFLFIVIGLKKTKSWRSFENSLPAFSGYLLIVSYFKVPSSACLIMFALAVIYTSTRRFLARPSAVLLSATG